MKKGTIFSNHFGKEKRISTVLMALAGQEGCDGEPWDEMQEAAEYIDYLERIIKHVNSSFAGKLVLRQCKEWLENEKDQME